MNVTTSAPRQHEESQAQFLRLFLAAEHELFRYVAALVPHLPDAQEIVQQTAIVLWSKFDRYDPQQPFTPWACRFALNIAKQWLARRKRWQSVLDGELTEQLVSRREELRPLFESRLRHLDTCLDRLPAPKRSIIDGYYFQRRSVESLAAELQRSEAAVYKLLQRIRALLRECLEHAALAGE
jgi:RNA polymerase sigma-70 factor (ECF subfamily)